VIGVTGMNDQTWFDRAGISHSEALHVTERYTRTSPDVISYEATIEDPKVFTRPGRCACRSTAVRRRTRSLWISSAWNRRRVDVRAVAKESRWGVTLDVLRVPLRRGAGALACRVGISCRRCGRAMTSVETSLDAAGKSARATSKGEWRRR